MHRAGRANTIQNQETRFEYLGFINLGKCIFIEIPMGFELTVPCSCINRNQSILLHRTPVEYLFLNLHNTHG